MLESSKQMRPEDAPSESVLRPDLVWREGVDFALVRSKLQHHRAAIIRTAAIVAFLCAALGALYGLARAHTYSAFSDLLISNTTVQISGPDAVVTPVMIENSIIEDEIELLKSSQVLDRVLDRLGARPVIDMLPRGGALHAVIAAVRLTSDQHRPAGGEALHDNALIALKANLAVSRVSTSQAIRVTVKAVSPTAASRLTNEVVNAALRDQEQANALVSTSAALRERIKVIGPTLRVITAATSPRAPDGPRAAFVLAISLFAGAFLGAGLGAGSALLDTRIVSAEQLAQLTPLEFFGYAPRLRAMRGRGEAVLDRAAAAPAQFARFNTVLRRARLAALERTGRSPRLIGVTSCLPGEGKTTIARELAELFASEGRRVLLVDAASDPKLTRHFALDPDRGLRQVLRGELSLSDVVQPEIAPFVDFLPAGAWNGDVDERWSELPQLIAESTDHVEWAILDLPPLSSVADVLAAAHAVQDLLLVVGWRRTRQERIRAALRALGPARDKLLGVLINRTPDHAVDEFAGANAVYAQAEALPPLAKPASLRDALRWARPRRTALHHAMRWACLAALFVVMLTASALADYKLGVSDRLRIKVQEWPDLDGEYLVNSSGVVSLPLVGEVKAADLRVEDVAREISDSLGQRARGGERPIAAVEVAQYRPFFILGDVQHPGQYAFQPGLTVLQAIGVAGGYFRLQDPGPLRLERDVVLAKGEIQTQSLRLLQLLARAARLAAAVNGQADVTFPAEVTAQAKDPEVAALMAQERAALALERREADREAKALVATRTLYQNAITTMQGQIAALKSERDLMTKHLGELQSLSVRGLGLTSTLFGLEREIAQTANEELSIRTSIVTSNESILQAEQNTQELSLQRSRADNRDLQQTRNEIADAGARIATAYQLIGEVHSTALAVLRRGLADEQNRGPIQLIRNDGGKTQEVEADESTKVEPGDIIKVPIPGRSANASDLIQSEHAPAMVQ